MALLNSGLFAWLHLKLSGQVKVLKSTLCMLPFPQLSPEQDRGLAELAGEANLAGIEDLTMRIFDLTDDDREFIGRGLTARK